MKLTCLDKLKAICTSSKMYLPYKEKEIQLSQLSYMTQSLDTPTWMIENRLILDRNDLY